MADVKYVMVPRYATEEMKNAGVTAWSHQWHNSKQWAAGVYEAMLAASPPPPVDWEKVGPEIVAILRDANLLEIQHRHDACAREPNFPDLPEPEDDQFGILAATHIHSLQADRAALLHKINAALAALQLADSPNAQ